MKCWNEVPNKLCTAQIENNLLKKNISSANKPYRQRAKNYHVMLHYKMFFYEYLIMENIVNSSTLILRQAILKIHTISLSMNMISEDLIKDNYDIPALLISFSKILIGGDNYSRKIW